MVAKQAMTQVVILVVREPQVIFPRRSTVSNTDIISSNTKKITAEAVKGNIDKQ